VRAVARLGELGGAPARTVKDLGIDFTGGKKVGAEYGPVRAGRVKAFRANIARSIKIKTKEQNKYKLFSTSSLPTLTYGHEVTGWTPVTLRRIRISAAKSLGIWCQGCSLEVLWAIHPLRDPLVFGAAGFIRYCTEWWNRTSPQLVQPHTLDAKCLVSAFNSSQRDVLSEGHRWKDCRGPISVMCKWLSFIGWTASSPVLFQTEEGLDVSIIDGSPVLAGKMFVTSLRKRLLRDEQQRHADRHATQLLLPWAAPAASLVRSKKLTKIMKGLVSRICGGRDLYWGQVARVGL
jgi:hypothetical protein